MQSADITAERAARHLIFRVGTEKFGVDAMRVREIVGLQSMTVVPGAAHGVKGVINLRGKVVPVVDLRETKEPATAKSSLIVMKADDALTVAMVVDEVIEVARVAGDVRLFDAEAALGAKQ
jgi:purine-binding chemotaxis protein CheW